MVRCGHFVRPLAIVGALWKEKRRAQTWKGKPNEGRKLRNTLTFSRMWVNIIEILRNDTWKANGHIGDIEAIPGH